MLLLAGLSVLMLAVITVAGQLLSEAAMVTDFSRKNLAPCLAYPFGTDWMGRDMFVRTITGLSMSIRIGLLTAAISAVIGNSPYPSAGAYFLCAGKGILGRCRRNFTDTLDFTCPPDPWGSPAAEAEPVHKNRGETGAGKAVDCF